MIFGRENGVWSRTFRTKPSHTQLAVLVFGAASIEIKPLSPPPVMARQSAAAGRGRRDTPADTDVMPDARLAPDRTIEPKMTISTQHD